MNKIDLMVLAPHEDDELAIAGPIIYEAVKKAKKIKIVFTTNGDYYRHEGEIRIREALSALQVLGVKKEDVIFLGYGDQTQSKHLYNSSKDEIVCSHNGSDRTYAIPEKKTFSNSEYGEEHTYTRENYKNDIKNVIVKYKPHILITTDWDNHMDHLALSLMLDECMGEILAQDESYTPLLLKAQAYTGKWEGPADYYTSCNLTEHVNQACGVEKEHPLNKWEDRIRFEVPKECQTSLLRNNILYKAARKYKSQSVDLKALQFINQDAVFWRRHTEGLSYRAKFKVSSGKAEYLNDFKCADCSDIVNDFRNYDQSIWIPDAADQEKQITIQLEKPEVLREICIYESNVLDGTIENVVIQFDNGRMIETGALNHDGSMTRIVLPEMEKVSSLRVKIEKWNGKLVGLTELEIYSRILELTDYDFPLEIWMDKQTKTNKASISVKIEETYMKYITYARGRLWPDKYFLMKRYDCLKESDSILKYWSMYTRFVVEKIREKI